MNPLDKALEKTVPNVMELTEWFCEVIAYQYGSHNFEKVKSIINQKLVK